MSPQDTQYGDYICNQFSSASGGVFSGCTPDPTAVDSAHQQVRRHTGVYCGQNSSDCIQPDGSGYYLVSLDQIGGYTESIYQAHNFHLHFDEYGSADVPPQHTAGYVVSPIWQITTEPWGMHPSFDWLAQTAKRPM